MSKAQEIAKLTKKTRENYTHNVRDYVTQYYPVLLQKIKNFAETNVESEIYLTIKTECCHSINDQNMIKELIVEKLVQDKFKVDNNGLIGDRIHVSWFV